jgi:hypothetical protein
MQPTKKTQSEPWKMHSVTELAVYQIGGGTQVSTNRIDELDSRNGTGAHGHCQRAFRIWRLYDPVLGLAAENERHFHFASIFENSIMWGKNAHFTK